MVHAVMSLYLKTDHVHICVRSSVRLAMANIVEARIAEEAKR